MADMMQGLINANAPIGQQDVMGGFLAGQKGAVDARKTIAETGGIEQDTRKKSYQQDLTEKLQQAIHASVDPTSGNIDPDKFKIEAHKYGVDPQAIDYALDNVLKVWTTAQGVSKAKNAVGAVSTTGATQVQDANKPTGTNWTSANADRGSLAVPTAPKKEEKDTTGFTTPDMEAGPSYKMTGSSVEGQGQTANDYSMTPDPSSLIQGDAPQAPKVPGVVEAISNIQPDASATVSTKPLPVNPIKVADLDPKTKKLLTTSLKQEGRIGKATKMGEYDTIAQTALDDLHNTYLGTVGNEPTKQMYMGADGSIDMGAYNRGISEYNAKVATAEKSFRDDIAKKYGEQFTQGMTVASNKRAEQASEQSKTTYGQTQDRIASIQNTPFEGGKLNKGITAENAPDIEKNLISYNRIEGAVKTINDIKNDPNLDKLTADQLAAKLKNFNVTMGQVEGLSTESQRETLEEGLRKNPAYAQLFKKYGIDADLTSFGGVVDFVKKIGIEKMTAQDRKTFLDLMGSPAEDALKHGAAVSALRIHASTPEAKGGWAGKPAKAGKGAGKEQPSTEITRKSGESYADFLRRKAKGGK